MALNPKKANRKQMRCGDSNISTALLLDELGDANYNKPYISGRRFEE